MTLGCPIEVIWFWVERSKVRVRLNSNTAWVWTLRVPSSADVVRSHDITTWQQRRTLKPRFHSNAITCMRCVRCVNETRKKLSRNKRKRQPIGMLGRSSGNHDWLLANASACVSSSSSSSSFYLLIKPRHNTMDIKTDWAGQQGSKLSANNCPYKKY